VHPSTFLSALPALLALAGFVLYQIVGANRSGDEISRRIVEKLRSDVTSEAPDGRLTPKQVERLLERRERLRQLVGEHDFRLLKQALTQQFVLTILVYALTLGFCAWSVYLFVHSSPIPKPKPPPDKSEVTTVQKSSGKNSPNVTSVGGAPVTITIQDGPAPTSAASKSGTKDK